jgi:hypothetical protein
MAVAPGCGAAATIDTRRAETQRGSAAPKAQESVARPAGGSRQTKVRKINALDGWNKIVKSPKPLKGLEENG